MRILLLTSALVAFSAASAHAENFQGASIGVDYYDLEAAASFPDIDPSFIVLDEANDLSLGGAGFSLGYTQRLGDSHFYLGGRIGYVSADQSGHLDLYSVGLERDYTLKSIGTIELRGGYGIDTPYGDFMPYAFVGVLTRDVTIRQSCPASGFVLDPCSPGGGASGYDRSGSLNDSTALFGAGVEWAPTSWASVDLRFGQANFDETTVSLGVDGQSPAQPLSVVFGEQEYSYISIGVRVRYDLLNNVGRRN